MRAVDKHIYITVIFGIISLFFPAPLLIFALILIVFSHNQKLLHIIMLYLALFFLVGYSIEPNYENDLIRYFYMLEESRFRDFSESLTWMDDGLFIKNFVFWFIGCFFDNHLLPAFSTCIVYGVGFFLIVKSVNRDAKLLRITVLMQFCFFPLLEIVSNVRNVSAFAIFALALYREFFLHKKNILTYVLYILPCFIHVTGILMLIFRGIVLVLNKRLYIIWGISFIVPTLAVLVYESGIWKIGNSDINNLLMYAITKTYTVSMSNSEYALTMQQSGYEISTAIIMSVVSIILMLLIFTYQNNCDREERKYLALTFLVLDMVVFCVCVGAVKFWVFAVGGILMSTPIIVHFIRIYSECRWLIKFAVFILWAGAIGRCGLEIYYIMDRIVIMETILNLMSTNVVMIACRAVLGLLFYL